MIHALSNHPPSPTSIDRPLRGSGQGREEFNLELGHHGGVERSSGAGESGRAARRRVPLRFGRRISEIHRRSEHAIEETQRKDPHEHGFGAQQEAPGQDDSGASPEESESEPSGQEEGRDFLELQAQLARLPHQPAQEVTLYLPSLGRISARTTADGVMVELAVPLRRLAALQRGQEDLRQRLQRAGIVVSSLVLRVLPAYLEDDDEPLAETGGAHGLVDVLA